MTSNPRIRVRDATPADVETMVDIHFAAFGKSVMTRLMFPAGVSEDARAKFAASFFPPAPAGDGAEPRPKNGQTLICVAEYLPEDGTADGAGEIVAFAKWTLYAEPRTEEEWKADARKPTVEMYGEGVDLAAVDTFLGEFSRRRAEYAKDEPTFCKGFASWSLLSVALILTFCAVLLGILACKPGRQGLGAGSALVRWGLDLADSLGLPTRLESSAVGYGLYKKLGFEDVDVIDFNVTETWGLVNGDGSYWGGNNAVALAGPAPDGVARDVSMRRPPKKTVV